MDGWIKLYRQLLGSNIFHNEKKLKVFIYCLLKATHTEHDQIVGRQKVHLMPGQFVFGRFVASEELKMKPSTVWDYMQSLMNDDSSIDIKSNNKYSVVTVVNWELYQSDTDKSDNKSDSKTTTNQQQIDTNKNVKNISSVVVEGEETAAASVNNVDKSYKRINTYFSNNIHLITPVEFQKLQYWIEDEGMHEDVIIFAIDEAVNQGKRTMAYIEGILKGYKANNIRSRADAEEAKRRFNEAKKKKQEQRNNVSAGKSSKPTFNNFKGREYNTKKLEEAMIKRGREELQNLPVEFEQRDEETIEEWQKRILALRKEG